MQGASLPRPSSRYFALLLSGLGLAGCGATRASGDPRTARPEKLPDNAIAIYVASEEPGEPWVLLDDKGAQVCKLPCSQWVAPKSGYKIQRDADREGERRSLELPDLDYPPGSVLDVVVERPPHTAGYVLLYAGGSTAILGVPFIVLGAAVPEPLDYSGAIPIGAVIVGVGGAALLAGVAVLATVPGSRSYLEVTRSPGERAQVEIGPGVLHVETAGARVDVTPFGAAGSF